LDVTDLRDYVYGSYLYFRIYFKLSLKKYKTNKEKLDFVEKNMDLFSDWWSTDIIGQFLNKNLDFNDHYQRATRYIKSCDLFTRRFAYVLFINKLASSKENLNKILKLIKNDDEYYVKMAIAWLLCELCVYHSKEIAEYIKTCSLTTEVKRMAINKIRDSFRIDDSVKRDLMNYREENF
jgi:3-methyladenine DNA glycosylase AlkD